MKGKILYGYIRESKEDGSGYSLKFQESVGEKIKKRFGFKKLVILNEGSGVSGNSNPFERSQGSVLNKKIKNDELKHLYVYEWSRLSRNNLHSELLRKLFRENEVELYEGDCKESKDLNNPIDELTSSILGSIYTYERQNMIKRIKEGLIQSRSNLKWSGVYLPYGYKKDENKKVTLDEIEVPIYLKMVDYVFEGKSIRWIVNWLNENSIPTKSNSVVKKGFIKFKNNDGSINEVTTKTMLWRDVVVRNILTKPYYKGLRIDKYGNQFKFPKIIDEQKWELLQQTIEENTSRNRSGNKQVHNYLLKNLVFCNRDNHKLLGRIKKDERTYYCNKKRKENRLKDELPCSLPSPNLDKLESFVWDKLTSILSNSHLIKEEFKTQQLQNYSYNKSRQIIEKEIKVLINKVEEIKLKKSKIIKLHLDDMIDPDEYNSMYLSLKNEEENLTDELNGKNNNLIILGDKGVWIDWVNNFSKEVKSWKSSMKFEVKREKVLRYIKKIVIDYNTNTKKYSIDIHLKYPMLNDKITWIDKDDKKKGYKIKKGKEIVKFNQNFTSYQTTNNI